MFESTQILPCLLAKCEILFASKLTLIMLMLLGKILQDEIESFWGVSLCYIELNGSIVLLCV